MVSASDA
jgi:hypothetical protein